MNANNTGTTMSRASACWQHAKSCWGWLTQLGGSSPRRLRLAESLPLGERRFVAVLELDGVRFLLGGTASSLVLLARLDVNEDRNENDLAGGDERSSERLGGTE